MCVCVGPDRRLIYVFFAVTTTDRATPYKASTSRVPLVTRRNNIIFVPSRPDPTVRYSNVTRLNIISLTYALKAVIYDVVVL